MEKSRHRNFLFGAAILTLTAGFTSFLIYLIEIILSSGFLGTAYFDLGLTATQNETGNVPLALPMYILRFLHNTCGLMGCLLISIAWTWQFRIWVRFSEAPFIRSFYFVGVAMIILFTDQILSICLEYIYNFFDPQSSIGGYPVEFRMILMVIFLIASIILPVYIYFLSKGGLLLRIPYKNEEPKSRMIVILPLIFFFLWFFGNLIQLGGGRIFTSLVTSIIQTFLFFAIFFPIAIGFLQWARKVDSSYLKNNLYLASVGSIALSIYGIVGLQQWFGMNILPGYILGFSILTWSLANISQFLGSREALSQRLRKAGAQFLAELGEAEMKDQSLKQMAKVMTDVSNGFMEDLSKVRVRAAPTENEIKRYILKAMGVEASPSEAEVLDYLKDAIMLKYQIDSGMH